MFQKTGHLACLAFAREFVQKKLARRLENFKRAKKGAHGRLFLQVYQEIAEKRGHPNLFDSVQK